MAVRQVFVHIGPFKSGTTFVQNVLWGNRTALAEQGVLVPGVDWRAQRRSVAQLMKRPPGVCRRDAWDRLEHEVGAGGAHTVVLSVEGLCTAEPHSVQALTESFAPAPVHVVYGARDLAAVVPADWQTRLRNREAPTWAEFVASVREPGGLDTLGGLFWRRQDPAASLPPYLQHLPRERIHIITVPPPGAPPALLWERFGAVLGLDADRYDLTVPRVNASLGGVEAEVLRRLTARTAGSLSVPDYKELVTRFVAREVLERRQQSFRLVLPEREHEWLDPRAEAAVDYLRTGGFDVVGDLDELAPVRVPGAREPDDVSETEVLELMEEVLGAVVLEMARRGAVTKRP